MSGLENLYGELAAALDVVIFEVSADSGMTLLSPTTSWISSCFGEPPESVAERSEFLDHFLAEAGEHWQGEAAEAALRSGIWEEAGQHFEAIALRIDGRNLLVLQRGGKVFEALSTQVQRSNELALERSKLNRETQRRVVLLDCVVHDLSNPMATILVNLQYLTKRLPDGSEREAAQTALDEVERQRAMLRSVVGLFSADLGLSGESDVTADVGEVIERAVRAQLDGALSCGVALDAELPTETQIVVAEPVHLLRAIENLVVNAIRHSPPNGNVHVRAVDDHGAVLIYVDDEGEGVDEALAESLFEPFERSGGDTGGQAGLGLFFCKRAVLRWGGKIGVEANTPKGARFWMRLRRAEA